MPSTVTTLDSIRGWLGLERNILVMLAALLVLGMGEEIWTRFVPKYLELLGAGAWVIAAYGTLRDLLDALYPYPGGWLTDHLGRRTALGIFCVLAALGYGIYLFAPSWEWVLVGTVFVMAWSSLTLPAIFAIIGDNLSPGRRAIGFGVQSILKRVPIVIAPVLGGWMMLSFGIGMGVQVGLIITLLAAGLAVLIILRYYVETERDPGPHIGFRSIWQGLDVRLKRLLVADCLARWAEGIPRVFIVLYVMDVLHVDALRFGWLTGLQMLVAILAYIPLAKLSDRMDRKPFILLTFVFFALFPLALVQASGFAGIALAFVVAGLRELGEPARKAMIVDFAGAQMRGRVVGTYYLLRGLVVFPAPLVGGWLWTLKPQWPFYAAFFVGVIGFLSYALWGPGDSPSPPRTSAA
jgi:MFS family permease